MCNLATFLPFKVSEQPPVVGSPNIPIIPTRIVLHFLHGSSNSQQRCNDATYLAPVAGRFVLNGTEPIRNEARRRASRVSIQDISTRHEGQ